MLCGFMRTIFWSARNDTQRTYEQDKAYQILHNYHTFKDKVEKLQRILDNFVKLEDLELSLSSSRRKSSIM